MNKLIKSIPLIEIDTYCIFLKKNNYINTFSIPNSYGYLNKDIADIKIKFKNDYRTFNDKNFIYSTELNLNRKCIYTKNKIVDENTLQAQKGIIETKYKCNISDYINYKNNSYLNEDDFINKNLTIFKKNKEKYDKENILYNKKELELIIKYDKYRLSIIKENEIIIKENEYIKELNKYIKENCDKIIIYKNVIYNYFCMNYNCEKDECLFMKHLKSDEHFYEIINYKELQNCQCRCGGTKCYTYTEKVCKICGEKSN